LFFFSAQPITINPVVGEVFGIRSSTDNSFNRGAVEEKLNENQYKVVLFDLGTKDIVSADSFVEIPEHLKQVSHFLLQSFVLYLMTMTFSLTVDCEI